MPVGTSSIPLMRIVAVLMGLICGVLIALIVELVRANPVWVDFPSNTTLLFALVLGWGLAIWLLLRRASGVLTVLQRGFLFGMVEWVVIGIIMAVFGRGVPPASAIDIEKASWEPARRVPNEISLGGLMGSVSIAFAALCLIGWGGAFIAQRIHERAVARRHDAVSPRPRPGR
jgi:hypothetical protein